MIRRHQIPPMRDNGNIVLTKKTCDSSRVFYIHVYSDALYDSRVIK